MSHLSIYTCPVTAYPNPSPDRPPPLILATQIFFCTSLYVYMAQDGLSQASGGIGHTHSVRECVSQKGEGGGGRTFCLFCMYLYPFTHTHPSAHPTTPTRVHTTLTHMHTIANTHTHTHTCAYNVHVPTSIEVGRDPFIPMLTIASSCGSVAKTDNR